MAKRLKQLLAEGKVVRVFGMGQLCSPKIVEIIGFQGGFDAVWLDQEHAALSIAQIEEASRAARGCGIDSFVRLAPTDYATVMRPMEAGAEGVMIAQIRTVDQVKQVVEWAKYPPLGTRGLFLANYEAGYGTADQQQHIDKANRDRWLAIQIETPEAVECADRIAAVEGVDCLFVGPGDLACTFGVPGQVMHPKCLAALERVSAVAKAAGKPWGVLSRNAEHADKCRALGCQLFSLVGDVDLVHRGFQATRKMFPGFFG